MLKFNKKDLREFRQNKITMVFQHFGYGIISIDDTIKAIQEKKTLQDIIQKDYFDTDEETYVQDLIPMAIETKYPIAVVDKIEKLQGIIVRASVLSGLVS